MQLVYKWNQGIGQWRKLLRSTETCHTALSLNRYSSCSTTIWQSPIFAAIYINHIFLLFPVSQSIQSGWERSFPSLISSENARHNLVNIQSAKLQNSCRISSVSLFLFPTHVGYYSQQCIPVAWGYELVQAPVTQVNQKPTNTDCWMVLQATPLSRAWTWLS